MRLLLLSMLLFIPARARAQAPAATEGEQVLKDFHFASGETLPALRIHYRTWGTPGHPAVLILHGTTGSGAQFIGDNFAGVLFGPGQLLDAARYFIIAPDGIGHGKSSKPSDGLHAHFPHYNYDDMVRAQHALLEALGVRHERLVMGTSMGGMQTWVWGETYPGEMDALLPLASLPVQIAGRNRIQRKMILDAIRTDPGWNGGDYKEEPRGLRTALDILFLMGGAPLRQQRELPTRDAADKYLDEWLKKELAIMDANDMLYAFDSSRDYDPAPKLESIRAPLTAINSADDLINPPQLGILERETKRVPGGEAVVLPITPETRGHGTHTWPALWKEHLARLLQRSEKSK